MKAHAGHELNELADEQAKLGTLDEEVNSLPVPWCILKKELKDKLLKSWNQRWTNEVTCRQTKLMLPSPDQNFSKYLIQSSRTELSSLIQFLTGHNYLLYQQFIFCLLYTSPSPRDRG